MNMMGNNGYDTTTRGGCTKKRLLCWICIGVVSIIVLALLITLIVSLVFRPVLPQFQVDSFSLKNFTAVSKDSSKVSFAADIAITSRNPNKKLGVSYAEIQSAVYYKTKPLGTNDVKSFTLGTQRKTSLNTSFAGDVDVGGINNANVASFELWLFTKFGYTGGKVNNVLKVFCGDLTVGLPSSDGKPGGLTGGPKQCKVGYSRKGARDPSF